MQKKSILLLVLLLFISAFLGSSVLTRGHFWGDDFAAYIMQAKSIQARDMDSFVERNAFTVLQSSHEEGHQMGPVAYPWGFPLMLTPVYALIGISPLGLKLPVLATYLVFLVTFFLLLRRRLTMTESLLIVSLFALNSKLLLFLDNIISDIPFLFLSTLAILITDIYVHETRSTQRLTFAALTGAAIFAAFFIRTQGVILLGSVLLFQGFRFLGQRKHPRHLVTDSIVIVAIFGILWGGTSLIFPGGQSSYLALYADFNMAFLMENIIGYSKLFGEFFAALPGQPLFFGVFAVFFFIGLIARFKTDLLFVIYTSLYLIVLWTWPEWQGYRMIFPVLPFFIYFSLQGINFILRQFPEFFAMNAKRLVYTMLIIISCAFLFTSSKNALTNLRSGREINGPFDPYSMATYEFIRNETPPESVIVFFKPRAMRLMTDHDALALTECERLLEGDYLALSKKVGENLQIPPERIAECKLPLNIVFENRRFVVYQVLR